MRGKRTAACFGGAVAWYASILLAACGQVQTQQGASLPSSVHVNVAPQLSGRPGTTIAAGSAYQFTPSAFDSDGDVLTFSITHKPAWAQFNVATGVLSGTPDAADVGSYPDIVIAVSDGKATAILQSFTLEVSAASVVGGNGGGNGSGSSSPNGTARLAWTVPTTNADGSALTNLAGYWIYYGTRSDALDRLQRIGDPATTQYLVTGLSSGTHFFAVTAFNSANVESRLSAVGNKSIP